MDLAQCIRQQKSILMEGALGERLKREHHLAFDPQVAMARLVYDPRGAAALRHLWGQYLHIAEHMASLSWPPRPHAGPTENGWLWQAWTAP